MSGSGVMCGAVLCDVDHLPGILVLNLCGEVRMQGVVGGKVLKVLTVGQLIAHIHVQQ